ncbi:MAG TPA: isoprenylcysteine carboxylmethyltransferase family protein [Myxococcota bacterium]|jgi:protein-S-isoprenylcysteine O-methyltransferase Ste14
MEPLSLARVALPLLMLVFAGVLLVWPVVRLRRETGVWAVTLHRNTTPGNRLMGLVFLGLVLGLVLLVARFALRGPASIGVWDEPSGLVLAGLLLCAAGVLVIAVAQRQMGASFRIGIDDAKTALVSRGLFRRVRNPIYSGLLVMLLGVMLAIPCPASVLLGSAAAVAIAIHTRLEERHLLALHGDAYRAYAAAVGRFLPGVGRLRA